MVPVTAQKKIPVTHDKNAIYIRNSTRDRLNLFKARFAVEVGAALTQDDALAILMNAWEAQHVDAEAVRFCATGA